METQEIEPEGKGELRRRTEGGSSKLAEGTGELGRKTEGGSGKLTEGNGELGRKTEGGSGKLTEGNGELERKTDGGSGELTEGNGELGRKTEGGSGELTDQELLLDLGWKLDVMEFELVKWTEGASGKDRDSLVWDLTAEHRRLREKHRRLLRNNMASDSGKGTEVDSFSGRKNILGVRRKANRLEKKMMFIKDKERQQSLIKEITSVERERKDLLGSLTPTVSLWKEIDSQTTWTIPTASAPSSSGDNDENQLADYFDLMLQDMEDLGHRMLSMLYFLNKSNDPICSYKATELCNTAAKLNTHISKGFNTGKEPETEPEEELGQINLSSLFGKYSRFPDNYNNTLTQLVMEEEENKCEDVKVNKTKEEEDREKDVSTMEYLKKRMDIDQQFLARDQKFWESVYGSRIGRCGGFMDTTILSPMQFTHCTPGSIPSPAAVAGSTLQIYSVKIKNLKGLNWPLRVYGEVAARDTVDRNRNILFSRSRFDYQELNGEDDSLCLTGPSRAIVALDHVDFEVDLQVVQGAGPQRLISCRGCYGGTDDLFSSLARVTDGGDGCTFSLSNDRCRAEVALEQLDGSLQATIMGVRVTEGRWPFKHGCRVVCSWSPAVTRDAIDTTTCRRVVLLDHCGRGLRRGPDGYLDLSRRVVSVESHGTLRVAMEAYGKSRRCIARKGDINFPVRQCQTRMLDCRVGNATVEVGVAWSLLVKEKACLSLGRLPRQAGMHACIYY